MSLEDKLKEFLEQLFLNVKASFSAIFIKDKLIITKTLYPDKKDELEEIIKLIIGRVDQINEFIPGFGKEYIFAEGEDVAIFVFFVRPDIAIASIVEYKPKLALLKLEHILIANKIKKIEDEIDRYLEIEKDERDVVVPNYNEEPVSQLKDIQTENFEEKIKEEQSENKAEITLEDVKDKFAEELEEIEKKEEEKKEETLNEIEELEKILSSGELQEEFAEENLSPSEEITQVPKESEKEILEEKEIGSSENPIETPEILEEQIYYDPEVLNKIEKELVYEIGPVGKFLFKKRKRELNIDPEKVSKDKLKELIEKLSNDIIDEKRRSKFYEKVTSLL